MKRKQAVNHRRMQFAAHVFVHTSQDGMIVSQIVKVSPVNLFKWSKTSQWQRELKFWGYCGPPFFKGEEFYRQAQQTLVHRSLKRAGRLWMQLFGLTENRHELDRFLKGDPSPLSVEKKSKGVKF